MNLQREDEAVSSTVATVLLFGGVVTIIGMMMASMMPVIMEMQGSIERNDMASQMGLLAQRADALSETGMPGDVATSKSGPLTENCVGTKPRVACGMPPRGPNPTPCVREACSTSMGNSTSAIPSQKRPQCALTTCGLARSALPLHHTFVGRIHGAQRHAWRGGNLGTGEGQPCRWGQRPRLARRRRGAPRSCTRWPDR